MSFPNIPDITPDISITFDDAINLLLISIALEEISLSKLMDAEKDKILFVLDECKHKDSALQDAIAINKSVDSTIKDMIKLQMLLQFKLENVTELITTTTSTTTTSTTTTTTTTRTTTTKTTSTTTTTHTTTCTTSTCSTTTKKECGCSVIGRGRGCISNKCDEFYREIATFQVFIFECDYNNRSLRYSVQNDDNCLKFSASAYNIEIECPTCNSPDKIVLHGKGHMRKKLKSQPDIAGNANFILTIWNKMLGKKEFKMVIISDNKPELNHNSGVVEFKNSDLKVESF